MNIKDIALCLTEFSEKHDLIGHAIKSCKVAIENCLEENPEEGYPLSEIELRFEKQEFVFKHHFYHTPCIKTQIGLYRLVQGAAPEDESGRYGYYILDTDMNNHFDDWLVYEE
ncbi:hypothetical protein R9C00_03745 [Flammeovirgaceae bacterium SG7u.111]|nr:hypothetical protein [Flammeovirgaceae bacterium SG7u.132]WPO36558.1 hypothetical protein R9C00_03745 [Flammeovirgaceae bacterium SG7u.111]